MAQDALPQLLSGIEDSQAARLVCSFISACNERDVDGAVKRLDTEVEIQPLRIGSQPSYSGHAGFRQMFGEMSGRIDHHIELTDVRRVRSHEVLLVGTIVIGEQRIPFAGIHTIKRGRITDIRHYVSTEVALRQVGAID